MGAREHPTRAPLRAQRCKAVLVPAAAPILERWNVEIVKVLNDPSVREALNKHGLTPQPTTRADLTAFMRKEDAKWGSIVRDRRITAD